jgi:hypothetical protein
LANGLGETDGLGDSLGEGLDEGLGEGLADGLGEVATVSAATGWAISRLPTSWLCGGCKR